MLTPNLLTTEEAYIIAFSLGLFTNKSNYDLDQMDKIIKFHSEYIDALSTVNLIRATGDIYTWLLRSKTHNCMCSNNEAIDNERLEIIKNAIVIYALDYEYTDSSNTNNMISYKQNAYNYLKSNGLVGFNVL